MSITMYEENGVNLWKVYVHQRSSKNKSKRFQKTIFGLKSEIAARKEERKLVKEISAKTQRFDGLGLCWEDVVHLWWKEVEAGYLGKITERSAEGYLSIINKWTREWMNRPAAEITRVDGRRLLITLERNELSRAYQKKIKNMIDKVYNWGIEFGFIIGPKSPPMRGLFVERKEEKVPDILSLEEIKKLLQAAKALSNRWYPIWSFAVLTGMRSGELHALTWDQLDLEKNLILVDRSYDSNTKSVGPTKARYWRTVPINSSLKKVISELKRIGSTTSGTHVLPRIKDWDNGDQAMALKRFLRTISLKPVKFHSLRACFATQMLASGISAPIVMKIGGWKKSATMDIYLRLAGVDTKGATDCLEFLPEEINFGDNVVSIFKG